MRSLDNPFINVEMIYNLFSNFGNITQILFLKSKECALIEYENSGYATICKDSLNNLKFFTNHLKVSKRENWIYLKILKIYYSNYQKIFLQKKNEMDSGNPEEIMICPPSMYRFRGTKSISMNPPSNTLHVSNLKLEVCKDEIIRKIFGQYGKIDSIK